MNSYNIFSNYEIDEAWFNMHYEILTHEFSTYNVSGAKVCRRCDTPALDVQGGSSPWVCSLLGQTMSCCGKTGYSKYVYDRSQWECSECKAVLSNDPNYVHSGAKTSWSDQNWWTPTVVHPVPQKEQFTTISPATDCTCGAFSINSNKHSPWCDWRPDGR